MNYEREPANMKDMGPKSYIQKIKKESKISDSNKNLDYRFSIPCKSKPNNVAVVCQHCDKTVFVTEYAILVVCGSCKGVTRIKNRVKK